MDWLNFGISDRVCGPWLGRICWCRTINSKIYFAGLKYFTNWVHLIFFNPTFLGLKWSNTIVLFQAYDTSHRLDNSLLQITLNITLRSQNNKEQKYNNGASHYLLTNWIMLICVFTVCSCREGDLVFSRPLTRTQVNSHWTTIVWGQNFKFHSMMLNG